MTRAERLERRARLEMLREVAREVVASGCCPECGSELRRNLALAGWWQCSQLGAPAFRACHDRPACSWQAFTD